MSSPISKAIQPESMQETLRLKCPECGGNLNLKRAHLGITGQCVHCHAPLTALEENGQISVIPGAPPASALAAPAPIAKTVNAPAADFGTNSSMWNFPGREIMPSAVPDFTDAIKSDFSLPPSNRETGNLIVDRNDLPEAIIAPPTPFSQPSPFGEAAPFQIPFSSMFKSEDNTAEINATWGTKVPTETHASISPFATGSAGGGGFAETLFRQKVEKDAAKEEVAFASGGQLGNTLAVPQPQAEKVILDGDGRPMAPWTKAEDEEFAKNFFAMERARGRQSKWKKRVIRFLSMVAGLGLTGLAVFFVTPQEKLLEWKTKAITWLEPGMAILDYLPEGMRPDWLPRTDLGIDAGLDENGKPKPKLNAFEGLKKLEVDIGNMRGAADDELKKLNDF